MARFDELFDSIVSKVKEVATVAGEKTSEVVETSKLKYRQSQVATDLEKAYAKLGAIVYEAKQKGEDFDSLSQMAIEEITVLNKRYDELEEEITLVGKTSASTSTATPAQAKPPTEVAIDDLEDYDDFGSIYQTEDKNVSEVKVADTIKLTLDPQITTPDSAKPVAAPPMEATASKPVSTTPEVVVNMQKIDEDLDNLVKELTDEKEELTKTEDKNISVEIIDDDEESESKFSID